VSYIFLHTNYKQICFRKYLEGILRIIYLFYQMSYEEEDQRLRQLTNDALTDEPFSGDNDSEIDLKLVSNHESDTEQDC
jgi:hypothetical protein